MAGWQRGLLAVALVAGMGGAGCSRTEDWLQSRAMTPQPPPGAGTGAVQQALKIQQQQVALAQGRGGALQEGQGGAGPQLAWSHTFTGRGFEALAVNPSWPSPYLRTWPQFDGVVQGRPESPPSWGFTFKGWQAGPLPGVVGPDKQTAYPSR